MWWQALTPRRQRRRAFGSLAASGRQAATQVEALPLQRLGDCADLSWVSQLSEDPEGATNEPNQSMREVKSGHFVHVDPMPLPEPKLAIYSQEVAELLGISAEEASSKEFAAFFSGDQSNLALDSWATPYALAIMGRRYVSNCPFGNGNGYGDGRAISVGEVVVGGQRWEMQLKGAGPTPFCRGGDGRAVLRSSVREFLASEAMHHLGVETTRALSLVVSGSEQVARPWYSDKKPAMPSAFRRDPDKVILEQCAITTRVAPSFLRVGHIDLFARRAAASKDPESVAYKEFEEIMEHAIFREYPELGPDLPLAERAVLMLDAFAERLGAMVAGWLRVGFCQGNFNSDNCLISGRTMDYGPFGWIERYDPMFAKWVGSGEHYAFMNQPQAAVANFTTLVTSVAVLLGEDSQARVVEIAQRGSGKIFRAAEEVPRLKLGFAASSTEADKLWQTLEPLMRSSGIDYTVFWRQLAAVLEAAGGSDEALLEPISFAFYGGPPTGDLQGSWMKWLKEWKEEVLLEEEGRGGGGAEAVAARLRKVNPKYVLREWMLRQAYDAAAEGDYGPLHELHELTKRPYDEQTQLQAKYYRRAPPEALLQGGVAFMT